MIQNNNTKDVAYLGSVIHPKAFSSTCKKESVFNTPSEIDWFIELTAVFDCSGTRYGFRIKELKSN